MSTWIALLRAVNVGGRNLKMAELRDIVAEAGGTDVRTYIQSGNVVFGHPGRSAAKLEALLSERIEAHTGYAVPVMVRSRQQVEKTIAAQPFPDADEAKLHVAFLARKPKAEELAPLDKARAGAEEWKVVGDALYLHLPNGVGNSKLAVAAGKLKVPATVRNWRTTNKLAEMAAEP